MSNRTQEQDGAMPAALAAILAEPGWREVDTGWYFNIDQTLMGNPGLYIFVTRDDPMQCRFCVDEVTFEELTADQIAGTLALMRRIEAALAAAPEQEGR